MDLSSLFERFLEPLKLVFKNHYTMTADRAALAMQLVEGIEIFGGVALNRAVGGLNAEAVRQMTQFDGGRGKVVWLPTFDAEYCHERERRGTIRVRSEGRVDDSPSTITWRSSRLSAPRTS